MQKWKAVFVIGHVPNKTHVFFSSDSAPAPQDMILKLMTQIVKRQISGKIPCEDILNSLNLWYLCKIWRRFLYIGLWWRTTSLGFLKFNSIWLKQFFECDVWNSHLENLKMTCRTHFVSPKPYDLGKNWERLLNMILFLREHSFNFGKFFMVLWKQLIEITN